MTNYEYILFDLDGTLTDPKEGITKCVQYALHSLGIEEFNLDKLEPFIGPPLSESFQEFYHLNSTDVAIAIEKYRERFSAIGIFENKVYPGIKQLLHALQYARKKVVLATSKPEVYARKILHKYELEPYFTHIVGSELDGSRVQKQEVIEEALSQLHLTEEGKKQTVMIGDRKYDIHAAKACHILSIGVSFGYAREQELELAKPDKIVDTVEELYHVLLP